jgi:hypothetical protein
MVITLIALVLLLLGGVALIRSFDTSASLAGNVAFRRDLKNQGERGMAAAVVAFKTGLLKDAATRNSNLGTANYSASILSSDNQGIPLLLLKSDSDFTGAGMTLADISDSSTSVKVRYVVDRLCLAAGNFDAASCVSNSSTCQGGGMDKPGGTSAGCQQLPVYRISVRADGPRNSQAFLQAMVTM